MSETIWIKSKASGKISSVTEDGWELMRRSGLSRNFIRFNPDDITPLRDDELVQTTTGGVAFVPPVTTAPEAVPVEVEEIILAKAEVPGDQDEVNPYAKYDPEPEQEQEQEPPKAASYRKRGRPGQDKPNDEQND